MFFCCTSILFKGDCGITLNYEMSKTRNIFKMYSTYLLKNVIFK